MNGRNEPSVPADAGIISDSLAQSGIQAFLTETSRKYGLTYHTTGPSPSGTAGDLYQIEAENTNSDTSAPATLSIGIGLDAERRVTAVTCVANSADASYALDVVRSCAALPYGGTAPAGVTAWLSQEYQAAIGESKKFHEGYFTPPHRVGRVDMQLSGSFRSTPQADDDTALGFTVYGV